MIIDSVVLTNVGVYRGTNEIALTPIGGKPVVLFGGLNGGGKTTFLDAVHLLLYGKRARCASRGTTPYKDYLRSLISRGVSDDDGASIEVTFRRLIAGKESTYEVRRSWFRGPQGEIQERLSVTRNGAPDPTLAENWDDFIENYIPYSIANLFFFDGEQITELANPTQAQQTLKTAIQALLGLDLVDTLYGDLGVLERKKRIELKPDSEVARLEVHEAQLKSLDLAVQAARQSVAHKNTLLERQKRQLTEIRDTYRHQGGELFEKASALATEKTRLTTELERAKSALHDVVADCLPLKLVQHLLSPLRDEADAQDRAHQAQRLLRDAIQRDERVLSRVSDEKTFTHAAISHLRNIFAEERIALEAASKRVNPFDLPEGLSQALAELVDDHLPRVDSQARVAVANYESAAERLARVDDSLSGVPEEAKIAGLRDSIRALEDLIAKAEGELAVENTKLNALTDEVSRKTDEVNELVRANNVAILASEEAQRLISHLGRVRTTLSRFKQEVVKRHASRLSSLILESFVQLARKSNLISEVIINPATFEMELRGDDGKLLAFGSLSAGERQLLATALLWGLAKASGRPLPTIIDTPLGRLDSSHREHLVNRYFPAVSHQVILLSTDEEIHEKYLKQLAPHIGRSYQLTFDGGEKRTKLSEGYFWGHAATN